MPRFALFSLLGLLAAPAPSARPEAAPPNVLILVADDFGTEQYAPYGEGVDLPNTPVLEGLAEDGVLFRNAWVSARCTPTRAAIQTGRYGFRTGIGNLLTFEGLALPLEETILPEMLDVGTGGEYAHAMFGKWHMANESVGGDAAPNLAGWSHFEGLTVSGFQDYFDWPKVTNGKVARTTKYATTDQVDSTLDWIGLQAQPWLACVSFVAPHNPLHAPPPELHSVDLSGAGNPLADPRPYYKAMVEAMDTEIGRLLDGLGAERQNTVVIFLADNGTQTQAAVLPHPADQAKGSLYEGGVRVPFVVSGPPVAVPGSECDALVGGVDLFATVAELAGVDLSAALPPDTVLDSRSLLPYLADPATPSQRSHLYTELFSPNAPGAPLTYERAVRSATHKLISRLGESDELYDLAQDPFEDDDLLLGPLSPENELAYQELLEALDDLLLPWPPLAHPYGCDNAPGTLSVADGAPVLGQNLVLAIDNPFPTQIPGSPTLLLVSQDPDPAFPCGTSFPGFGFEGAGAPGEALILLSGAKEVPGQPWGGVGQPALVPLSVPADGLPLVERPLYFQAAVLGLPGSEVAVGVTSALKVQFAP